MEKLKVIRITTIPSSLGGLLTGQLGFMQDHYMVIGISSSGNGGLERVAEQEGIKVVEVEMTRLITPLKDLQALYRLYRIFKKEKPYIVHSHTPKAGTLCMAAAYFAGVPNRLHTVAGLPLLEAKGIKRKLLEAVEKKTYFFASKIYPNSFGLKEIIRKNRYTSPEKLKVIGNGSSNGIDTKHFDPNLYDQNSKDSLKKTLSISQEDFVFLFVGRIVKDKGINELVSAFVKINEKHKHIKLLLVGGYEKQLDPVLPETEKLIQSHPAIIYVGFQPDVRPYFAISDILVFPSYREGFPNVVMQAGAMGIPTIATDINGCNEIITNNKNGVIVPPKNETALSEAMISFVIDRNKVSKLSHFAREMITSNYERSYVWGEMLKEYRCLEKE